MVTYNYNNWTITVFNKDFEAELLRVATDILIMHKDGSSFEGGDKLISIIRLISEKCNNPRLVVRIKEIERTIISDIYGQTSCPTISDNQIDLMLIISLFEGWVSKAQLSSSLESTAKIIQKHLTVFNNMLIDSNSRNAELNATLLDGTNPKT